MIIHYRTYLQLGIANTFAKPKNLYSISNQIQRPFNCYFRLHYQKWMYCYNCIFTIPTIPTAEISVDSNGRQQCPLGNIHYGPHDLPLGGPTTHSVVHQQQIASTSIEGPPTPRLHTLPVMSPWARGPTALPGMHPHCQECTVPHTPPVISRTNAKTPTPPMPTNSNMVRTCGCENRHALPWHRDRHSPSTSAITRATKATRLGSTLSRTIIPLLGNCDRWNTPAISPKRRTSIDPNTQVALAIHIGYVDASQPAPPSERQPTEHPQLSSSSNNAVWTKRALTPSCPRCAFPTATGPHTESPSPTTRTMGGPRTQVL